jgi:TRAP transporter TAXI family solute receptor
MVLAARRRWALLATVVAVAVAGVGLVMLHGCRGLLCDGVQYPSGGIRMSTGGVGGVYAAYGEAYEAILAEDLPGLAVNLENSGGSVDNLTRLADNKTDLTFISGDTAYLIPQLEKAAHDPGRIKAVARIYDEYVQVVVRADSPIHTLADLRGKRVSVGSPGSSVEVTAGRLLAAAGINENTDISLRQLSIAESSWGLETGGIDAFFWVGGLPTGAVSALADAVRIRLLPLDHYVDELHSQYGSFYQAATVPAGTYHHVDVDTKTTAVPSYLLVSSQLSEELVYRLTAALFNHQTEISDRVPSGRVLDIRSAINTASIPLHPGAVRYYRSVKP